MKEVASLIANSKHCVALTGAGISTESGIPDFRSKDGLWSRYEPEEYAYIGSFLRNPAKVWKMLTEMIESIKNVKPNPAHYALAEMEKLGYVKAVITQNIDELHTRAGSKNVIEFHGNFSRLTCMNCGREYSINEVEIKEVPRCKCNGVLKPNIVFFGESIPRKALIKAFDVAKKCDVMLVIGTSCAVYPANELPLVAKMNGAKIVEINREESEIADIADYKLRGNVREILPALVKEIKNLD